jgi:hypothetical protein
MGLAVATGVLDVASSVAHLAADACDTLKAGGCTQVEVNSWVDECEDLREGSPHAPAMASCADSVGVGGLAANTAATRVVGQAVVEGLRKCGFRPGTGADEYLDLMYGMPLALLSPPESRMLREGYFSHTLRTLDVDGVDDGGLGSDARVAGLGVLCYCWQSFSFTLQHVASFRSSALLLHLT